MAARNHAGREPVEIRAGPVSDPAAAVSAGGMRVDIDEAAGVAAETAARAMRRPPAA